MARLQWDLEVTQEDIEEAFQNDSYNCVIAQCIARAIPDAKRIEVDLQTIRFTREGERFSFLTPYAAAGYIVAFDAGESIEPFSFRLREPRIKPSRTQTTEGKRVKRGRDKMDRLREQLAKAESVLENPESSKAERAKAEVIVEETPGLIEDARAEYKSLAKEYKEAGIQLATNKGPTLPPKVYKTKRREFGQRVLRVNQAEGRKHYV